MRLAKGWILLGAVALVVVGFLARRPGSEPEATPKAPPRMPPPAIAAPAPSVEAVTLRAAPTRTSPENEVARAMDDTAVLQHLARLRTSAASGDEAGRESAIRSLVRHGKPARPFLDQAIASERDGVVRHYLVEAKNAIR